MTRRRAHEVLKWISFLRVLVLIALDLFWIFWAGKIVEKCLFTILTGLDFKDPGEEIAQRNLKAQQGAKERRDEQAAAIVAAARRKEEHQEWKRAKEQQKRASAEAKKREKKAARRKLEKTRRARRRPARKPARKRARKRAMQPAQRRPRPLLHTKTHCVPPLRHRKKRMHSGRRPLAARPPGVRPQPPTSACCWRSVKPRRVLGGGGEEKSS